MAVLPHQLRLLGVALLPIQHGGDRLQEQGAGRPPLLHHPIRLHHQAEAVGGQVVVEAGLLVVQQRQQHIRPQGGPLLGPILPLPVETRPIPQGLQGPADPAAGLGRFKGGGQQRPVRLADGTLGADVEPAKLVHLVVEEFDPTGVLPLGREHVQNVAAERHLAGALQHVHPLVAGADQVRKKLAGRQDVPPLHHLHLGHEGLRRRQPLQKGRPAGDDQAGHPQHQPGQDPQPLAPPLRGGRLNVDQGQFPGQKQKGVGTIGPKLVVQFHGRRLGVQDH